jgi:hypothetical protein
MHSVRKLLIPTLTVSCNLSINYFSPKGEQAQKYAATHDEKRMRRNELLKEGQGETWIL